MRIATAGLTLIILTTPASAELLSTMHILRESATLSVPATMAVELRLDENDYEFYYRTPEVTPADVPESFFVDRDEFIYGDNFWGVGPETTTLWWHNLIRWLTDGVASGDSATLITLALAPSPVGGGGFSTSKECLAGVITCDNPHRTVETNFMSNNGVDFAGYRATAFQVDIDRFGSRDGGGYEFAYTFRLYGRPVPEPSCWILAVIAWIVWHYQTPNFLRR